MKNNFFALLLGALLTIPYVLRAEEVEIQFARTTCYALQRL